MSAIVMCGRSLFVIASIVAVTYVALHIDGGGESTERQKSYHLGFVSAVSAHLTSKH